MRILVAEGEIRLGQVLAQGLSEAHYAVDLARDGEEALAFERAAEHLPRIFERFYRADSALVRATGGTGLGLAICDWVARAHGGSLGVESQPGRGAMFTLRLPTAGAAASRASPIAGVGAA